MEPVTTPLRKPRRVQADTVVMVSRRARFALVVPAHLAADFDIVAPFPAPDGHYVVDCRRHGLRPHGLRPQAETAR